MNRRRTAFAAGGLTLFVVTLIGGESVRSLVPVTALVTLLGNDYLFVAALGAVGLLLAAPVLVSGRAAALTQTRMPDAEKPVSVPPAGATFDETITSWSFRLPLVAREERTAVRDRLHEAAVETVMRAEGCDRATAERRVETGTWTADAVAASYLGGSASSPAPDALLGALVRGETWAEHRARRTADTIVARATEGSR